MKDSNYNKNDLMFLSESFDKTYELISDRLDCILDIHAINEAAGFVPNSTDILKSLTIKAIKFIEDSIEEEYKKLLEDDEIELKEEVMDIFFSMFMESISTAIYCRYLRNVVDESNSISSDEEDLLDAFMCGKVTLDAIRKEFGVEYANDLLKKASDKLVSEARNSKEKAKKDSHIIQLSEERFKKILNEAVSEDLYRLKKMFDIED